MVSPKSTLATQYVVAKIPDLRPLLLMVVTDYDWTELWNSVIGLLNFLASKIDSLHTTGGVELLASEVSRLFTALFTLRSDV